MSEDAIKMTKREREIVRHLEKNPGSYLWHTDQGGEAMAICNVGDLRVRRWPTLRRMVEKGLLVCLNPNDKEGDWAYGLLRTLARRPMPFVSAQDGMVEVTFFDNRPGDLFELSDEGVAQLGQALVEHVEAGGSLHCTCSSSVDFPEENGFGDGAETDIRGFVQDACEAARLHLAAQDEPRYFILAQVRRVRQTPKGKWAFEFRLRPDQGWTEAQTDVAPGLISEEDL